MIPETFVFSLIFDLVSNDNELVPDVTRTLFVFLTVSPVRQQLPEKRLVVSPAPSASLSPSGSSDGSTDEEIASIHANRLDTAAQMEQLRRYHIYLFVLLDLHTASFT